MACKVKALQKMNSLQNNDVRKHSTMLPTHFVAVMNALKVPFVP